MSWKTCQERIYQVAELIRSLGVPVTIKRVALRDEKLLNLAINLLSEVFLAALPVIRHSLTEPELVIEAPPDLGILTLLVEVFELHLIDKVDNGLVLRIQLGYVKRNSGTIMISAVVRQPIPLLLLPELRVNIGALEDRFLSEKHKLKNGLRVYYWRQDELKKYLEHLQKLRRYVNFVKLLRDLLYNWTRRNNVEVFLASSIPCIRDVVKAPNTGFIIWIVDLGEEINLGE